MLVNQARAIGGIVLQRQAASFVDAFSALAFTYDNRNRVKTVDNATTPGAPRVVLNYTYDDVGNVLSVIDTINGAAGATTGYLYDALNRMTRTTQVGSGLANKRVDLTYNPLGQFASIERYSDLGGTQRVVGTSYTCNSGNNYMLFDDLTVQVDPPAPLVFSRAVRTNASTFTLTWNAEASYRYNVFGSTTTLASWQLLTPTAITATQTSDLTYADTTVTGVPRKFYEIKRVYP